MERIEYGLYEYEVYEHWPDCHRDTNLGFCYVIYKQKREEVYRDSDEWYNTREEAEKAAINHIDLLEDGEG